MSLALIASTARPWSIHWRARCPSVGPMWMTKGQWLRSFPTESGSRKSGTRVPRGSIIERTATMAPGCHRPANLGETAEATEPVIAAVAATFAVSKQAAAIRLTGERLLGGSRGDGGHARGRQTSGRG
jgi:hypothetical protein